MLKKLVYALLLVIAAFFCASAAFAASESDSDSMLELVRKPKMSVSSGGIADGVIGSEYGKRGRQQRGGVPALSLPITTQLMGIYSLRPRLREVTNNGAKQEQKYLSKEMVAK